MQQQFETTLDLFKHLALTAEEQTQLKGGNNDDTTTDDIVTEEEIVN